MLSSMGHIPKVSVLMPVFNGEKYLKEAIDSILNQSFSNFEFIIINDGSTDRSFDIINSYKDYRIRLIQFKVNRGLIETLNAGIKLARGEYIARMDSDDISLPERLSKQVGFLDGHPKVSVVSTRILLINEQGEIKGDWPGDDGSLTFEQIYKKLLQGNCIAHPSIMIRRSEAVNYPYHPSQINSEDYDLWLRLCADHKMIQKLDRVLLKYRVHQESISKISTPFKREWVTIKTKVRFLVNRFQNFHFNKFDLAILESLLKEPFVLFIFLMKPVLRRHRTK